MKKIAMLCLALLLLQGLAMMQVGAAGGAGGGGPPGWPPHAMPALAGWSWPPTKRKKKKGKTGSSKEKKRLRKLQALLQGSSSSSEEEDDDDADVDMARVMKLGAMGGARFARLMMRQPGVADFGDLGDQATKEPAVPAKVQAGDQHAQATQWAKKAPDTWEQEDSYGRHGSGGRKPPADRLSRPWRGYQFCWTCSEKSFAPGFSCTNRDCAVSFWGQWDDYKKKHNIEEWEKPQADGAAWPQADGADQAGQGYKQQGDKQQEEKKDEKNDAAPAAPEEAKPSEDGKEKPENVIWVPEEHEDKDDDEDDDEPPVPAAVAKSAAKKKQESRSENTYKE